MGKLSRFEVRILTKPCLLRKGPAIWILPHLLVDLCDRRPEGLRSRKLSFGPVRVSRHLLPLRKRTWSDSVWYASRSATLDFFRRPLTSERLATVKSTGNNLLPQALSHASHSRVPVRRLIRGIGKVAFFLIRATAKGFSSGPHGSSLGQKTDGNIRHLTKMAARYGFRVHLASSHGLMTVMPAARNGAVSRVATVNSTAAAIAAMKPSAWPMIVPLPRACAIRLA